MRKIKRFNNNFKEEIQEFCEYNLTYLLDDGQLQVDSEGSTTLVKISITDSTWSMIKDYMIPFLTRLLNNYHIEIAGVDKGILLNIPTFNLGDPLFTAKTKFPFNVEDLIKDKNPYSVKSRSIHPDKVQLEDLIISSLQFFVRNK